MALLESQAGYSIVDLGMLGFVTFVTATGVTWMLTPAVIRIARAIGALDLPGGRKAHSEPIPRIGGLAVFFGFVAGLVVAAAATGLLFLRPQDSVNWRGLAVAATFLLIVGLWDDLRGLSFYGKFAAQILAGVYAWHCGFLIETLTNPLGDPLELGWLSLPLTVLWIVGVTNAVNLIDGLDGLAAGIALIITVAVGVLALVRNDLGLTAASVALAGALVGFLRFNFNPARIFLGDSGSLFLGFVLAVTTVRGQKGGTLVAILAPLLILGVPLFDTGLAVLRRLYRVGNQGIRSDNALAYMVRNFDHIFRPDRGHIHHRLIDWGLTHRGAVLCLYGLGTVFALAAFALVLVKSHWLGLLLVAVLFAAMGVFFLVVYARARRAAQRASAPCTEASSPPVEPLASSRGQL